MAGDYWWANTSVNGRMYWDITNLDSKTKRLNGTSVDSADNGTSFDIKRFYVGIDHQFNDVFSGNVTTDFNYVAADGETQVYIKKAYLRANLSKGFDLRVGSTDLPWVPFVEGIYGYRYVENVLIDRIAFRHLRRLGRARGRVRSATRTASCSNMRSPRSTARATRSRSVPARSISKAAPM